jgi:hypothetical protein
LPGGGIGVASLIASRRTTPIVAPVATTVSRLGRPPVSPGTAMAMSGRISRVPVGATLSSTDTGIGYDTYQICNFLENTNTEIHI